ncbi:MAG: DNA polymerase III subunit gamma/tau [Elainellaceae cyanobacterium]
MVYEPLHHKYRPQTFAQLVGQEAIAATLTNALRQSRIAPAYLFCGPRGTGKTSSARILAKSLNCISTDQPTPEPCGTCEICTEIVKGAALDIIEIDAASNTGVDNIRELIERAQFAPVRCRYKVYIIDEVHMLSTAAFNALLKTLEEPPDRVAFVLATTDPQRVLPTIISRCQRFDFRRIPLGSMVDHLRHIAQQERIDAAPEAIALVAQISQGGLRDAESLLDQLSLNEDTITPETVWELVGAVPERELLSLAGAIADDDGVAVLDRARHLMDRGREPLIVLQNLASFFRDLLVAKTAPPRRDLVAVTDETWQGMTALAQRLNLPNILHAQQRLRESEVQVKNTTQPRLWLEVTLMGLLPSSLALAEGSGAASSSVSGATNRGMGKSQPPRTSATPAATPAVTPVATPAATPAQRNSGAEAIAHSPAPVSKPASSPKPESASAPSAPPPSTSSEPAVSAETPPAQAAASTPPMSPPVDLAQTWRDVLQQLRPPGIQALLRQHGHLMKFDGKAARVGIVSSPLMKIAEQRVKNVELAFEKALNAQVNVTFQVTGQVTETPAAPKSTPAGPQSASPQAAPTRDEVAVPTSRPPASDAPSGPLAPGDGGEAELPPLTAIADPSDAPMPAPSSTPPSVPTSMPPPIPPDEDSTVQAAKSFANMFNGQVIEWNEDWDFLPAQDSAESSPASSSKTSRRVERGEPDIDVPF